MATSATMTMIFMRLCEFAGRPSLGERRGDAKLCRLRQTPRLAAPVPPARAADASAAIAAVAVFVAAGNWQRAPDAREGSAARAVRRAPPRSRPECPRSAATRTGRALRYRAVVATGNSTRARQILIDNKVHDGQRRLSRRHAAQARRRPRRAGQSRLDRRRARARRAAARSRRRPGTSSSGRSHRHSAGRVSRVARGARRRRGMAEPRSRALRGGDGRRRAAVRDRATRAPAPDDGLVRDWPAPDFGIEQHRVTCCSGIRSGRWRCVLWLGAQLAARAGTRCLTRAVAAAARGACARSPHVLLIAALAIAPIVASYAIYYLFPRDERVNYGSCSRRRRRRRIEGIAAGRHALPRSPTCAATGCCSRAARRAATPRASARSTRRGRRARCRAASRTRIVRVWLVAGDAAPRRRLDWREHPGLVVARRCRPARARRVAAMATARSWLLDPLGNLVLRYPADPDIKRLAQDLAACSGRRGSASAAVENLIVARSRRLARGSRSRSLAATWTAIPMTTLALAESACASSSR